MMSIQRMTPQEFLAQSEQEEQEEYRLINGEPVPSEPAPQIQYIPIAGVDTNTEKQIPWGLIGVISVVGLISLAIVAVVVGGKK